MLAQVGSGRVNPSSSAWPVDRVIPRNVLAVGALNPPLHPLREQRRLRPRCVQLGSAGERLPEPRHPFSLEIISPDRPSVFVNLGPHPPRLWPEDLERLHDLWLNLTSHEFDSKLHHRDVVGAALLRLERDLESGRRAEAVADLHSELHKD